jgi:GNAT superfamily N-acetyltransferase
MTTDPDTRDATPQTADTADDVTIVERPVGHPDAVRLLQAFYHEQVGRYGFAESVNLDAAEYRPPGGIFAVVYRYGTAVGCGGYRSYPQQLDTIEVKRLYLVPGQRGSGTGRTLLSWLERHARLAGARQVILETGSRNTTALHLFTVAGYQPIPGYAPDRDPTINRAFTKPLTPSATASHRTRRPATAG